MHVHYSNTSTFTTKRFAAVQLLKLLQSFLLLCLYSLHILQQSCLEKLYSGNGSDGCSTSVPQAFNFALHFLLFKAKNGEVEEEEGEKKTHCRTLWSCLQMSVRTTSGQDDYPPVRPPSCTSCLLSDCHSLTVMGALHCDWHEPPCEWSNLDAHRLHNYHFIKNVFGPRCKWKANLIFISIFV